MVQELEQRYGAAYVDEESSEEDEDDSDDEEESEEESEGEDEDEDEESEDEDDDEFEDEEDGEGKVKRIVQKMESGKNGDEGRGGDGEEESDEEENDDDEEDDSDEEESGEEEEGEEGKDEEKDNRAFLDEPDGGLRDVDAEAQRRRKMIIGVACICCVVLILSIVLGVTLGGGDDDDDKKPSGPPPTPAPISPPSPSPSTAPTLHPDLILFPVVADTYIRSGAFATESYGNSSALRVLGGGNVTDISYVLLEFDLTNLPTDANIFRESEIILRLSHIESLSNETDAISVIKLPYNDTLDLETLTWDNFNPGDGVIGPTFTVEGDTENVLVDITELVRGAQVRRLRQGRRLQAEKFYIQLENVDSDSEFGEAFRSREDGALTAPVIIHNFKTEAPSAAPSSSMKPSAAPSMSAAPSISPAPSTSREPSPAPSISSAPTISEAPSGTPTNAANSSSTGLPSPMPSTLAGPTSTVAPSLSGAPSLAVLG